MAKNDDTLKDLQRIRTKILKELDHGGPGMAKDVSTGLRERLSQVNRDIEKHQKKNVKKLKDDRDFPDFPTPKDKGPKLDVDPHYKKGGKTKSYRYGGKTKKSSKGSSGRYSQHN